MIYHDTGNEWTFLLASTWKNSVNSTIGGVGMLIGPRALKSRNSIEKIQPRIMVATFNHNSSTKIISCYNPTNVSEETDLVAFYNELPSRVRSIPKHNVLIIGVDMSAKIGKNVNHKFSLHNLSNRNGEYLTDFTLEKRLTYSSFEGVSFSHQIVTAKMRLILWRSVAWTTTNVHYDWSLLNNRNIRYKYMLARTKKFDVL